MEAEKKWVCKVCKKTFAFESDLKRHLDRVKPCKPPSEDSLECPKCEKKYTNRDALNKHLKKCGKPDVKVVVEERQILAEQNQKLAVELAAAKKLIRDNKLIGFEYAENLNCYFNPDLTVLLGKPIRLRLVAMERFGVSLYIGLIGAIWFRDPPSNHSIKLAKSANKFKVVEDSKWIERPQTEVAARIQKFGYELVLKEFWSLDGVDEDVKKTTIANSERLEDPGELRVVIEVLNYYVKQAAGLAVEIPLTLKQ